MAGRGPTDLTLAAQEEAAGVAGYGGTGVVHHWIHLPALVQTRLNEVKTHPDALTC